MDNNLCCGDCTGQEQEQEATFELALKNNLQMQDELRQHEGLLRTKLQHFQIAREKKK